MTAGAPNDLTDLPGAGPLVFKQLNIPVARGHWSTTISPALRESNAWNFYQINIGHPYTGDPHTLTINGDGSEYDLLRIE